MHGTNPSIFMKNQDNNQKQFDKFYQSNLDSTKLNKVALEKELINSTEFLNSEYNYLYPNLDDPDFNIKITERKEFNDYKYDGMVYDAKERADQLCNADFELAPHQLFVRNFMSFQTPYNSLLLYHGLGTGKTCSAIRACTGNKFLKEINPMNMKGLSKERVISQIKGIINNAYLFIGYIEFANYIQNKSKVESDLNGKKKEALIKKKLQKVFNNRLIIIDEIHNKWLFFFHLNMSQFDDHLKDSNPALLIEIKNRIRLANI